MVDSSKGYGVGGNNGAPGATGGAGGAGGGKRFVPQAKRRANAARLRQLNARRSDAQQGGNVGRYSQPQRTRWTRPSGR